jgi:transcriptional regulator with XRE-family HTH domain
MLITVKNMEGAKFFMTVGENIKMLRESKYMSILDVQEITGLSKSTIRELERDISNSILDKISTFDKIAHAFNMTTDELLLKICKRKL